MPTSPGAEPPIDDAHPDQHPEVLSGPVSQGPAIEQPAKLIRIAAMIREMLEDVRQSKPDEPGRRRLREVYERALTGLKEGVSKELQDELDTLTIPLDSSSSESEIRLAQAQLVGWLEGLFQGIQAALWSQHMQARAEIEEMRRRRGCRRAPTTGPPGSPVSTYNFSGLRGNSFLIPDHGVLTGRHLDPVGRELQKVANSLSFRIRLGAKRHFVRAMRAAHEIGRHRSLLLDPETGSKTDAIARPVTRC